MASISLWMEKVAFWHMHFHRSMEEIYTSTMMKHGLLNGVIKVIFLKLFKVADGEVRCYFNI